jgi:hypothetical protein
LTVNEFYKKGCQEKTSPSTGVEILSRDPAHYSFISPEKLLFSILLSFSADGDDVGEFERAASELALQRQPWFYPRLVAYGYFWLSERA